MDQTGRNLYLTGGSGLRDTGSNQAVKLRFSMDPLDKVLRCESEDLPTLLRKRFHHSSMIVRDCLFVFFGKTYNRIESDCKEFEYLSLNQKNAGFKNLNCDYPEENKGKKERVFRQPMIFPQTSA